MANLPVEVDQLPAYLKKYAPEDLDNSEFDVPGGEPLAIVSIRGSKWKVRYKGEEGILRDADGYAQPFFECVLVRASKIITKTFYLNDYTEGSNTPPDCMSSDGIKPDAVSPHKQHHECSSCPHNQWNSARRGKGKRCQDNERMAVLPATDLLNENLGGAMLLRIPPGSFNNLKAYQKSCTERNRKIGVGITRLSFDPEAAYPEIQFEWMGYLDEDSSDVVIECRNSAHVQRILNLTPQEIAQAAGAAEPEEEEASEPAEAPTAAAATARERVAAAQAAQAKPAVKPVPAPAPAKAVAKAVVAKPAPAPAKVATVVPIKKVAVPEETAREKKQREAMEAIENAKRLAAELQEMDSEESEEGAFVGEDPAELDGEITVEVTSEEEATDPADDFLDDLDRQIGAIPG